MSDWTLINVTFTESYLSVDGWQVIADLIGGEVKSAADWGFTSISGLWRQPSSMSALAVYVPEGANYGLIDYGGWSSGSPDTNMYIVPMTGGGVTAMGGYGGGLDSSNTTARIFVGDGFSCIAPLDNVSYYRVFGFDTVHDFVGNRDFKAACFFGQGVSSARFFDLEEGIDLYTMNQNEMCIGLNIAQNDGRLYMEVLNMMLSVNDSDGYVGTIYTAEHFYRRYYGYETREKNILINGIKFTTPLGSEVYFPTE